MWALTAVGAQKKGDEGGGGAVIDMVRCGALSRQLQRVGCLGLGLGLSLTLWPDP